jgi:hypothetical protein
MSITRYAPTTIANRSNPADRLSPLEVRAIMEERYEAEWVRFADVQAAIEARCGEDRERLRTERDEALCSSEHNAQLAEKLRDELAAAHLSLDKAEAELRTARAEAAALRQDKKMLAECGAAMARWADAAPAAEGR